MAWALSWKPRPSDTHRGRCLSGVGLRTGALAGCRGDSDLGSTPLRTLAVDRGCRGRGEGPASQGHRVGVRFGSWAQPGPAAQAARHLGVLGFEEASGVPSPGA